MLVPSKEEADAALDDIADMNNKPVDDEIFAAVSYLYRIATGLGMTTHSSCAGHGDWGNPYPVVAFKVPVVKYELPGILKVVERKKMIRHNEKHAQYAKAKAAQVCSMFTKILLNYYFGRKVSAENMFHFVCTSETHFVLRPVYTQLAHSYKSAGDYYLLDDLLNAQRDELYAIGEFIFNELKDLDTLIGIPPDGCPGCLGVVD